MNATRALVVLLLVLGAAACGRSDPQVSGAVPPPAGPTERTVFVLLGGDETEDPPGIGSLTRAWEQVIYSSLPPSSVLVDLADRRPTARIVVREQLPRAQSLRPTVATVWLGQADAEANTSVEVFTDYLEQIVTGLQEAGARSVLLLSQRNTGGPPSRLADESPLPAPGSGPDTGTGTTEPAEESGDDRYDGAIDAIAARTGAKVVALRPGRLTQEHLASAVRPHVEP